MNTASTRKALARTLYASAAFLCLSAAAEASELADLKSTIEGLSAKDPLWVTAPAVPQAYNIIPAADTAAAEDVEEPFTEYKLTGYVKTGYIFSEVKDGRGPGNDKTYDDSSDFDAEAGLNVKSSVQSSLGEVGATLQIKWDIAESSTNASSIALRDDGFIAFWQFVPTMKLEAGRSNAGRLENGIDKNTRRIWSIANRRVRSENAGNGFYDRDMYNAFAGINYTDGPMSISVRAHDATRGVGDKDSSGGNDDDAVGYSAKAVYTAEIVTLEAVGGYWGKDDAENLTIDKQTGVKWLAGVGAELGFIPGLPVSVAYQMGELHSGAEQWNVSASTSYALTDEITLGIGAGLKEVKNSPTASDNRTEKAVIGGIYYAPMAQLILGVEGDWLDDGKPADTSNDGFTSAVVARLSF